MYLLGVVQNLPDDTAASFGIPPKLALHNRQEPVLIYEKEIERPDASS